MTTNPAINTSANPVFKSKVNTRSAEFTANSETMQALVNDLNEKMQERTKGGGEQYQQRH